MKIIQTAVVFCATSLVLAQPAKAQSGYQFTFSTNDDGTLNIEQYGGNDYEVDIPATTNGMSIASIAGGAFSDSINLYYVTIPSSITNIGVAAFDGCLALTTIAVDPQNLYYSTFYSADNGALCDKNQTTFIQCPGEVYASYDIPNGITSIAEGAFNDCSSLPSVTIPNSVTNIGDSAFSGCSSLASVYFTGNAPAADSTVFTEDALTVYYMPCTAGWDDFSAETGVPVVLWNPLIQTGDGSFGVQSNQFGFNITGTNNFTAVVEACTNLASPVWVPLQTVTLANGSFYFNDAQWTNYCDRFYGLRMP